ncbi:DUF4199 family protein [Balneolaceae bacterium ANBcel3]|nr:DUF4199 family protein [Balneolaceae bacterium ANBcel3]
MESEKSMLKPVLMTGLIFGFVLFLVGILAGYYIISKEPTGRFFMVTFLTVGPTCLIALFISFFAVKSYVKENGPEMTLGKGAIIGLSAAAIAAAVSVVFMFIWPMIDSSYLENYYSALIAETEITTALPPEMREPMIDAYYEEMRSSNSITSFLSNLVSSVFMLSLLNAITGLIAAKIFGTRPVETL